ncbi:50S ribosomal protein L21 [Candidatus Hodgkinia cicadicola]|nr:50S ribosomal protein L21 [Candidatus Hodgkinia cicadicola]
MIVNVNNNHYKLSRFGLVKLKNTKANGANIIIGNAICFKCGNEVFHSNGTSKWVALIKPIGLEKQKKLLGAKFKRRKGYKRSVNVKRQNLLAQVTNLIKDSERSGPDNSGA